MMVEHRLGPGQLLTLYFISGVIGVLCHAAVPPLPAGPIAGASLAISGMLGAYLAWTCTERLHSKWYRHALVPIEVLAVSCMAAWVGVRTVPIHADRTTALLDHLLPMTAMWVLVRCGLVASRVFTNPGQGSG